MVVAVVSDVFDVHSSGDDPLLLLEDSQLVGLDGKPGLLPPQPVHLHHGLQLPTSLGSHGWSQKLHLRRDAGSLQPSQTGHPGLLHGGGGDVHGLPEVPGHILLLVGVDGDVLGHAGLSGHSHIP